MKILVTLSYRHHRDIGKSRTWTSQNFDTDADMKDFETAFSFGVAHITGNVGGILYTVYTTICWQQKFFEP